MGAGDPHEIARNKPLAEPRPGYTDLVGMNKYGSNDAKPVLEHTSAHEAAARVAPGAIAAAANGQVVRASVFSRVMRIGKAASENAPSGPDAVETFDTSLVKCLDPAVEVTMIVEIDEAEKGGDTLDGVVEVLVYGIPQGLGMYATSMDGFNAWLAAAATPIQSVKNMEIGGGSTGARCRGSVIHDEIIREGSFRRLTNWAGGIEGEMSSSEAIRIRLVFEPISTIPRTLHTIDTAAGEPATALHRRSDVIVVVPGAVVAEAMISFVAMQALIEKMGGDYVNQMRESLAAYLISIPKARA